MKWKHESINKLSIVKHNSWSYQNHKVCQWTSAPAPAEAPCRQSRGGGQLSERGGHGEFTAPLMSSTTTSTTTHFRSIQVNSPDLVSWQGAPGILKSNAETVMRRGTESLSSSSSPQDAPSGPKSWFQHDSAPLASKTTLNTVLLLAQMSSGCYPSRSRSIQVGYRPSQLWNHHHHHHHSSFCKPLRHIEG